MEPCAGRTSSDDADLLEKLRLAGGASDAELKLARQVAQLADERDEAENRFVKARDEASELEQEMADLRLELRNTKIDRDARLRAANHQAALWFGIAFVAIGILSALCLWIRLHP